MYHRPTLSYDTHARFSFRPHLSSHTASHPFSWLPYFMTAWFRHSRSFHQYFLRPATYLQFSFILHSSLLLLLAWKLLATNDLARLLLGSDCLFELLFLFELRMAHSRSLHPVCKISATFLLYFAQLVPIHLGSPLSEKPGDSRRRELTVVRQKVRGDRFGTK